MMPALTKTEFNESCRLFWQRLIASPDWQALGLPTQEPPKKNHMQVVLPYEHCWGLLYREMPGQQLDEIGVLVKFDRPPGLALWADLATSNDPRLPAGVRFSQKQDGSRHFGNMVISEPVRPRGSFSEAQQIEWLSGHAARLFGSFTQVMSSRLAR